MPCLHHISSGICALSSHSNITTTRRSPGCYTAESVYQTYFSLQFQVTLRPSASFSCRLTNSQCRGSLSSSRQTYSHPQALAQRSAPLPPSILSRNIPWGFQSPSLTPFWGLVPIDLPWRHCQRASGLEAQNVRCVWVQPSLDGWEEGTGEGIFNHFNRPSQLSLWVSSNHLQPLVLESHRRCLPISSPEGGF